MTLVIAAEGKDFVVLISDGKGMWTEEDGTRFESRNEDKMFKLSKYTCALIAGDSELGAEFIESFKLKNKGCANWPMRRVVKAFSKHCKKELGHLTDIVHPANNNFPDIVYVIGGMDKVGRKFFPIINILRSQRNLCMVGRKRRNAAEGSPLIARYILSKNYSENLSLNEMCLLVAEAMAETITIDGNVGGKVRMSVVDKRTGVREFTADIVEKFLKGPVNYRESLIAEEKKNLIKLIRE